MPILIATVSILVITTLVWLLNKLTFLKICPICVGVAGTWAWLLTSAWLSLLPLSGFQLPIAILIGGSVVGIAYQLEKNLSLHRPLIWKTLFISTGFIAAYGLISFSWRIFLPSAILLIILIPIFNQRPKHPKVQNKKVAELENKMKNCCGFSAIGASIIIAAIIIFLSWIYSNGLKNKAVPEQSKTVEHTSQIIKETSGSLLPISWGELGKKLVESGVIETKQFESLYQEFEPLLHEAQQMIYESDNKNLIINAQNSGLFLNLFWALGLANKNPILENGPMTDSRYGDPGRFASTGGWTISKGSVMNHYSKHVLLALTPEQQALVEQVSQNIYRPCCDNSAYFPDCNHGMAMLGLLELLASQGFNEQEIYQTALIFNLYWFPGQYETIAKYLAMNGYTLQSINPKDILGKDLSSASAYQRIASIIPKVENQGGDCSLKTQTLIKNQNSNCGL